LFLLQADLLEGYATAAPSSWSLMRLGGCFHGAVEPRQRAAQRRFGQVGAGSIKLRKPAFGGAVIA
jgi:hypothetical protein